jgi:hypothetical protein
MLRSRPSKMISFFLNSRLLVCRVAIRANLVHLSLVMIDTLDEVQLARVLEVVLARFGAKIEDPALGESNEPRVVIDGSPAYGVLVFHGWMRLDF